MKRILLLILPLLAIVTAAKSQTFRVGIVGGLTVTDVDGMDQTDADNDFNKPGFTIGGLVNTQISPKSTLQLEIAYTQKGSMQLADSTHNNNYYLLQLNYLDVTLLWKKQVHLGINKKQTDKYGFEAGLTGGSLIYSSFTAKSIPYTITGLSNIDASAVIGLYYNFSDNFYFSGTYSNSFLPAIAHDAFPGGSYGLYYGAWNRGNNLAFQLTFGFIFGSKRDVSETPVDDTQPASGN